MILYCYDSTGLYVGPISPRLDAAKPFDADGTPRFLHPKNATATPPPTVQSGYAAVFNAQAGTWSLVEDHRGGNRLLHHDRVSGASGGSGGRSHGIHPSAPP